MQRPHAAAGALALGLLLPATAQDPDRAQLEERFRKTMSGCRLVGRFTITGSDRAPQEDRYTISKVEKVGGDRWRFHARIEYGGKSVTVPVVVAVRWAGDTPMIQVTDLKVPLLGTYTARVLVYRNRYAGTWSGGGHEGHMFGRVERLRRVVRAPWPRWRGPTADGAAPPDADPPVRWSEDEGVAWKTALPGRGSSTPILVGGRLIVTTAVPTGKVLEGEPEPSGDAPRTRRGRRRGRFARAAPREVHRFEVVAVDAESGAIAWRTVVREEVPHEAGHPTASHASDSPVTDGERIYASFGSRGVHCLSLDGERIWSRDLGRMHTRNQFGEGSSPALHGDTLVLVRDHEGDSFVVALDKRTGEERWRRPRDEPTSWSTPLVVEVDGRPQVVVAATNASRGYDLATGEEIWRCSGMTLNCIPTPIHRDGVVYLTSGFRGSMLQALRLAGARGDLEGTEHVLFEHGRNTPYVPSPVLVDDHIYFLRVNSGVLSCLDARTGKVVYEGERLRGMRTVYSSLVAAAGRIYVTSREGVTHVVRAGPEPKVLATNRLDDGFDASAVIVGGSIFLRGHRHLYRLGR